MVSSPRAAATLSLANGVEVSTFESSHNYHAFTAMPIDVTLRFRLPRLAVACALRPAAFNPPLYMRRASSASTTLF